jgi:D-cysteine desulfhydrase family pyridoxal phosphate-dependent enzyme
VEWNKPKGLFRLGKTRNKGEIMLPRLHFAHLPTPIEALPRLSAELQGPQIWVKRDDQTGLAFGGNKTRKLEFLIPDAQAAGAETLITAGAVQSNHCRQTAAAASRFGFACILVLVGEKPSDSSGNYFLDQFLGAEIVWAGGSGREQVLEQTFKSALEDGKKPYLIPYGGSNEKGAAAYAFAMQEMLEQKDDLDWIVFPSSSGGTQTGLVVGGQMFGYQGRILGISIDNPAPVLQKSVAKLAEETARILGKRSRFLPNEILVNDNYLGAGYGVMAEPEAEALKLFAQQEGLLLDPVYTGRAAAGLIDLSRSGFFTADHNVLFWHTGGTPALFAYPYLEMLLVG